MAKNWKEAKTENNRELAGLAVITGMVEPTIGRLG